MASPPLLKYVWFDGNYVASEKAMVPITTHAIHYGTSVFEGIRAYWNGKNLHVFRLEEHVKRFRRSGQFYNISLNFSDEQVTDGIVGICKKNEIKKSCYIRPFYFVGDHGISLHVTEKAPQTLQSLRFHLEICSAKMESQQQLHLGESFLTCRHLLKQRWVETISTLSLPHRKQKETA